MKRFLIVVGLLAALLIAAAAIFIATFDGDRYRPQAVRALEERLGRAVDVRRLSLGWQGGLAVRAEGLAVYEGRDRTGEPLAQAASAGAVVRLLPLLKRRIEVPSVTVEDASGHWKDAAAPATEVWVKAVDVTARLGRLPVDPARLDEVEADVRVTDGTVRFSGLAAPVESIRLAAAMTGGRIELRSGSATLAGGTLRAGGRIEHLAVQPRTTLTLTAEHLSLERLLPTAAPGVPRLTGTLSASFEGTAHGLAAGDITRTLAGTGRLQLADGKIEGLNVLRAVFERLSMLPGLMERLQARLPEASRQRLEARDTVFQPVDLSMTVADGAIELRRLQVESDACALTGAARVGLDGRLSGQVTLAVEPGLSEAIIRSVNELQALADEEGRLSLPVDVQGRLPQVTVLPDLGDVASRLVATKTREWLGSVLGDVLKSREAAPDGAVPPATP